MAKESGGAEQLEMQPVLPFAETGGVINTWDLYPRDDITLRQRWQTATPSEKIKLAFFPTVIAATTLIGGIIGLQGELSAIADAHRDDAAAIGKLALCREYLRTVPGDEPKITSISLIPSDAQENCGVAAEAKSAKDWLYSWRSYRPPSEDSPLPAVVDITTTIRLPREDAVTAEMERLRGDMKDNGFWPSFGSTLGGTFLGLMSGIMLSGVSVTAINKLKKMQKPSEEQS